MRIKSIFILLLSVLLSSVINAQVTNYALQLKEGSSLSSGAIQELDNLDNFTVQMWINPSKWTTGAAIFNRGEGTEAFSLKIGTTNELILQVGAQTLAFTSTDIAANKWAQISIMAETGNIRIYVNNRQVKNETLTGLKIPASTANFVLGNNFNGRIDEFRLWKTALKDHNYYLWRNTLNKYHPEWESLITYYKFDQNLCPDNIVDYKFNHHGEFIGNDVARVEVKDNRKFVYRINSAYTDIGRWSDRRVDREKYLMANDIIMIAGHTQPDGELKIHLPANHGTITNGEYIKEFEGRKGVLSLNGPGAQMNVGKKALNDKIDKYTFHTWMYLDEWVEGAFLFKKEANEKQGFSIRFGKAENKEIIVRINGQEYIRTIPRNDEVLKKWFFIGIFSNTSAVSPDDFFQFIFGTRQNKGARIYPTPAPTSLTPANVSNVDAIVGLNMKGKLDETAIWEDSFGYDNLMGYREGLPFPSHTVALDPASIVFKMNSAWKYDDPNDLGYDFYSYHNVMKSIKEDYANHRGYKIRLSVAGHHNWAASFANATIRNKIATNIAKLGTEYDGIDLDFEWCYDYTCWRNYGLLIEKIAELLPKDKVFSVSPHGCCYGIPVKSMKGVDFFTFQIYGPQKNWYTWNSFEQAYNNFIRHGYPAEKILMSYAAITSGAFNGNTLVGPPIGIGYFADPNYRPHMDSFIDAQGNTRYVTGVNQTRRRSEFMQDKEGAGIFYWDMGNDLNTSHPYSLARISNFGISSNVDSIVYTVKQTGIKEVFQKQKSKVTIYPNPATEYIKVQIPGNSANSKYDISIINSAGQLITQQTLNSEEKMAISSLKAGIYIVKAATANGEIHYQTFIKREN